MTYCTTGKGNRPFDKCVPTARKTLWYVAILALAVAGGAVQSSAAELANGDSGQRSEVSVARLVINRAASPKRKLSRAQRLRLKRLRARRQRQRERQRLHRTPTPTTVPNLQPTRSPGNTPAADPTRAPATATPVRTATKAPAASNTPAPTATPLPPTATPGSQPTTQPQPPLPQLSKWESQMKSYGATHCAMLKNPGTPYDTALNGTYYDAQWVYEQIAEYTGDTTWYSCADAVEKVYRDKYVMASNGAIPGYWNFTHGILEDYIRTNDENSAKAVRLLATNAAYAPDTTPLSYTADAAYSREVAYTIEAYLDQEEMGNARRPKLTALVDQAFDHMDQWFGRKNAPYVRPFMVGLTAHALIRWYDKTGDARVLPAVQKAMDALWSQMWLPAAGAFKYTDRVVDSGGTEAAPDLNLLIVPSYGWLYKKTGDVKYRDQGDAIFVGGVNGAFMVNPKQFNQNYRWSFEYVRDRK